MTTLTRNLPVRQKFDPANAEHVAEFKFFTSNLRWKKSCPFFLEEPFLDIPTLCSQRFLEHSMK